MEIKSRLTRSFLELKVDEVETTIFKESTEPSEVINNLLSIIDDLCVLTDKEFYFEIKDKE